eukprot:GEMP01071993.1.p1 GENE.GEMP01071993.1~~GEMP01071993.1.p1  ORF type:complete len:252 (+),score=56.59 GEMP01071993.1:121-876(+)
MIAPIDPNDQFYTAVLESSEMDQKAELLDDEGDVQQACKLYKDSAHLLHVALTRFAPPDHPDIPLITARKEQLDARREYLEGPREPGMRRPVGDFIKPIKLSEMNVPLYADKGSSITVGKTLLGTAAVVGAGAGLLIAGPLGLVAGAGAAAYAITRNNAVGEASRGAVDDAKGFNEKHQISGKIQDGASSAVAKVNEIDDKHGISGSVKGGISAAGQKVGEIDQQYNISGQANALFAQGTTAVTGLFQKKP